MQALTSLVAVAALSCTCLGGQPAPTQPAPTQPAAPAAQAVVDTSPQVCEGILNAPIAEVWKVWSTAEGFKMLGAAKAEMDFRVGGLIRARYNPEGTLDDEGTIHNRIIAFEPERMLAIRIEKPPKGFPYMEAYKTVWTVITITDLGDNRTHLRVAGMGYTAEPESQAMRAFFEKGNGWTIKKLQSHFDAAVKVASPATAHSDQPLAPIDVSAVIPAAREDVYRAFTTAAGWKAFWGADSRIEAHVGGPFEIYFIADGPAGQRGSEGCTVLSLIPGEMFSYTWNAPPTLPHARANHTWVVVTFESVSPTSTRVRARQFGFTERALEFPEYADEFKQSREHFVKAWPMVLEAMRKHFAHEEGAAPVGK